MTRCVIASPSYAGHLLGALLALELTAPAAAFAGVAEQAAAAAAAARSSSPPEAEEARVYTIPLQKQYVPMMKAEKIIAYKTAYFGSVKVGDPVQQSFTVVFDTGSGHLILPSTACHSETCTKHRRYNRTVSASALDIEADGTVISPDAVERDQVSIAFGTGEVVGEFVREVVCLGEPGMDCVALHVVLATEMTSDPFGLFAFDGVLGLGLEALTLTPAFSFFHQMFRQSSRVQPCFAVFLARRDGGESEISFGGHEERRASSALAWAPVAMPELGYWQVQLKRVLIGSTPLEECEDGSCRAIFDTGTSMLGVPRQTARNMHRLLARAAKQDQGEDSSSIDCRGVPGHPITFEVADANLTLTQEEYSRPTPFNMTVGNSSKSQLICRSLLLPVDMGPPLGTKVFIWGEPVLRRYYTVYDLAKKRVGFTLAQEPEEGVEGLPAVGAPPPGSLISGAPLPPLAKKGAEQAPEHPAGAGEAPAREAHADPPESAARRALEAERAAARAELEALRAERDQARAEVARLRGEAPLAV